MLFSLFFNYGNANTKKEGTHYGVSFDTMACMDATKSSTSFVMLSKYTPWILFSTMEQVQYKIMEPLLLLVAWYLT
jgi:hypothetical protein